MNGIIAALIMVYVLYIIEQTGTCFMNSMCVGGGDVMCVNSLLEVTNQWFKDWFALQMLFFFFLCLSVLAQRGYFKDKAFVNYLKYLLYWKEPEYAKYLK